MTEDVEARLEALKLVKEWSSGLIVVQTGAVAIIGALLKEPPTGWFLGLVLALFAVLILSIWFGAVAVVGTVPYIAQKLPTMPNCDIYDQKGGLGGRTLGQQCSYQERLFIISLVLFAAALILRPASEADAVQIAKPVQVQIISTTVPPTNSTTGAHSP